VAPAIVIGGGEIIGGVLGAILGLAGGAALTHDEPELPEESEPEEDNIDDQSPKTKYGGQTPDNKKEDFVKLKGKGRKGKRLKSKQDGAIWEEDKDGHGGSRWKRWPNEKAWENDRGRESVRPDGSVR